MNIFTRYISGCKGGIGRGEVLGGGLGGGGGYGGRGGDGSFNGTRAEGGISYGNLDLPCFIGSGSGNDSIGDSTAGGGIVGKIVSMSFFFFLIKVNLINNETMKYKKTSIKIKTSVP